MYIYERYMQLNKVNIFLKYSENASKLIGLLNNVFERHGGIHPAR